MSHFVPISAAVTAGKWGSLGKYRARGRGTWSSYEIGGWNDAMTDEHHGVTPDGMRYFGLISLRSTYTVYEDTFGLRNSHDRSFPVGIGFGSRVFVCDNLAFIADQVTKRKHTANLKRDLPGVDGKLIEPLALHREAQARTLTRYRQTMLAEQQADHAILDLYREGVVNIQRAPDVMAQFAEPMHEEWGNRTARTLFNAVSFALNGPVIENPQATPKLHRIIDGVCTEVGHA